MKKSFGVPEFLGVLVCVLLFMWAFTSYQKEDAARTALKSKCMNNPTVETCKACADEPYRDMDICRSILANLVTNGKKGR